MSQKVLHPSSPKIYAHVYLQYIYINNTIYRHTFFSESSLAKTHLSESTFGVSSMIFPPILDLRKTAVHETSSFTEVSGYSPSEEGKNA